jgi:L-alanine-DL-glutamate epimerase-like enolase superfamily enzyme
VKVTGVELTAVRVPYTAELGRVVTAGLTLDAAEHVIVEVRTDTGIIGLGEAVPRPSVYGETLDGVRAAMRDLLVPPLIGLDPHDVERAWAGWERVVGNTTAKAALDMALHDIIGKAAGVPVAKLLGGWADGSIPLTMAIGLGTREAMAEQAGSAVALGFRAVKLKVGKDVAADIAAVHAVRAVVGDDVLLYADANGGYDRLDAMRALRGFAGAGLAFAEEPVAPGDTEGRVRLAAATGVPLLLDESINDLAGLRRELAAGTAGAVSARAPRTGFTLTRHVIGAATTAGVPGLVGSHRELGVGLAANAQLAAGWHCLRFPAELGTARFLEHQLLTEPLEIHDGRLRLTGGPGLGVELDRDAVDHYRLWRTSLGGDS